MVTLIEGVCGIWVMVQVKQVGIVGQVVQGVGSLEVSVTGGPDGGVPVAVARLYT